MVKKRVSPSFAHEQGWTPLSKNHKKEWYRRSLFYTDTLLKKIYEYGTSYLNLQSMIYCSDHGENLKYTHTSSPFYEDMVHIPFWIYLSPAYTKTYPKITASLSQHKEAIFTNDLLFDTIAGLLQIHHDELSENYQLTSPQYNLTPDEALTLHGKKKIFP